MFAIPVILPHDSQGQPHPQNPRGEYDAREGHSHASRGRRGGGRRRVPGLGPTPGNGGADIEHGRERVAVGRPGDRDGGGGRRVRRPGIGDRIGRRYRERGGLGRGGVRRHRSLEVCREVCRFEVCREVCRGRGFDVGCRDRSRGVRRGWAGKDRGGGRRRGWDVRLRERAAEDGRRRDGERDDRLHGEFSLPFGPDCGDGGWLYL